MTSNLKKLRARVALKKRSIMDDREERSLKKELKNLDKQRAEGPIRRGAADIAKVTGAALVKGGKRFIEIQKAKIEAEGNPVTGRGDPRRKKKKPSQGYTNAFSEF